MNTGRGKTESKQINRKRKKCSNKESEKTKQRTDK